MAATPVAAATAGETINHFLSLNAARQIDRSFARQSSQSRNAQAVKAISQGRVFLFFFVIGVGVVVEVLSFGGSRGRFFLSHDSCALSPDFLNVTPSLRG
jgi:hypothetical protein